MPIYIYIYMGETAAQVSHLLVCAISQKLN